MTYSEYQAWTLTCRSEDEAVSLVLHLARSAGYLQREGQAVRVYARASTIQAALAQFRLAVTAPYQEGQAGPLPAGESEGEPG